MAAGLLAGCGGPASTGVLTNANIPAALKLKQNNSDRAQNLATAFNQTYQGCTGHYAVFTEGGRKPTPALTGKTIYTQVFSESASCPSVAKATSEFRTVAARVEGFGGTTVKGIGDAAFIVPAQSSSAMSYVLFWREGPLLASVQLVGSRKNKLITKTEIELLAKRQIALSPQ